MSALLHELFEEQAQRTPHATAIIYQNHTLTYQQLDHHANNIAWQLHHNGTQPDDIIGLCTQRSPEMIIGLLAILKAGAAYLPLDPTLPTNRLNYMTTDAKTTTILTTHATNHHFPHHNTITLNHTTNPHHTHKPPTNTTPHNLAYLIYTSGSTGQPKGVGMTHQSAHRLVWTLRELIVGDNPHPQRTTLNAPIFFDGSIKAFGWLFGGATMVIVPDEARRDPQAMLDLLNREEVDIMDCTPAHMEMIASIGAMGQLPAGIRIIVAGEAINDNLWKLLASERFEAYNLYGPTECNAVSLTPIRGEPTPSIGRPMPGYDVLIVDRHGNLTPTGVPGELMVGGARLARGYHRRPGLTAQRFTPDGITGHIGRVLYRTGDLARYRSDGQIEFIGRRDNQVKLRGYRLELGEVETTISRYPGVTGCAALIRDDPALGKQLIAYLTANSQLVMDLLLEAMRTELPDYMIPSAIMQVEQFPLTANGKIDRAALPQPDFTTPRSGPVTAPRDAVEQLLAEAWDDVLRLGRPAGIYENFFDAGGHSLLAVQLMARVNRTFAVRLPLQTMYFDPTPAGVAQGLRQLTSPDLLLKRAQIIIDVRQMSEEELSIALQASQA